MQKNILLAVFPKPGSLCSFSMHIWFPSMQAAVFLLFPVQFMMPFAPKFRYLSSSYPSLLASLLFFLKSVEGMDDVWRPPDANYVKLNIHCLQIDHPLPNGNSISIGAILRNKAGDKLWGGLGPLNEMTEGQALLRGMHAGVIEALKWKEHRVHIDLDNQDIFEVLRFQDEIVVVDELVEALAQFNSLHNNHFEEGLTARRLSLVSPKMNATAIYMASYGMEHLSLFVEAPGMFGDLHTYLERDMGLYLPAFMVENIEKFDSGEVEDPPSPPSPLPKKRRISPYPHSSVPDHCPIGEKCACLGPPASMKVAFRFAPVKPPVGVIDPGASTSKGKTKVLSGFSFNNDGLFSQEAIQIIDSGELASILNLKAKAGMDLDMQIRKDKSVKDFLEDLTRKKLQSLNLAEEMRRLESEEDPAFNYMGLEISVSFSSPKLELMEVEEVLLELKKLKDSNAPASI